MNTENDNQNRWRKLKDVFNEAVELAPESRASYLAALRLNEETLYNELAELIEIDEEAEDFLDAPISLKSDSFSPPSFIGKTIGNYQIMREVARGGMGTVFEAVRSDGEFEQRVAVKLVNLNFFSDELDKRFKRERQILAKLEHPNIVRLLDGGFTRDKTPYYVMEFIEGTPVNVYCRENNLDTNRKLNLFLQICEAVAYAHRQFIVHRDLKPSNILVTKNGQVKLLDFGIAKILESDTDAQKQTQNAPMTPAYSSPEQIKGETITAASDVFSLGVILYELLTEKSPHEIYGVGRMEILRSICETEPHPPSVALSSRFKGQSSNSGAEASKNNNQQTSNIEQPTNLESEIQNLKTLKGDLDKIVLKALRKEKDQLYNTFEQFDE
jgi:serine/threonine protein kinase